MGTTLHTKLFKDVNDEIAEAKKQIADGQRRLDEAEALREILHDVLMVDRPKVTAAPPVKPKIVSPYPNTPQAGAEFRRKVLSALEEQTPHDARDIAERIDEPLGQFATNRIKKHLLALEKAGRVKMVGMRQRQRGVGRAAHYYVRLPLNGDEPREVIWP